MRKNIEKKEKKTHQHYLFPSTDTSMSSFRSPQAMSHYENVIYDLIIAGTETTSTILTFAMRDMALRPELQTKVIDNH